MALRTEKSGGGTGPCDRRDGVQAGRGINGAEKGTEDESRAGDGGVCVSGQRMGRLVAREPLLDEQRARGPARAGGLGAGEDS